MGAIETSRLSHCCASYHGITRVTDLSLQRRRLSDVTKKDGRSILMSVPAQFRAPLFLHSNRYKSDSTSAINNTDTTSSVPSLAEGQYIPEPPSAEVTSTVVEQLNALGEPTLASLGLCANNPSGWVQGILEYMHVTGDLPWWATFAVFGVLLRILITPLQVVGQRISIPVSNNAPKFMELAQEMQAASRRNDMITAQLIGLKIQKYKETHDLKYWKIPLSFAYQAPIFLSVLFAIRGMANVPVPSLTTGGISWISDLTIADPYFVLPALATGTMLLVMELGAEGVKTRTLSTKQKWITRGMIMCIVPWIVATNSAGFGMYWFAANLTAVGTGYMLNVPRIKTRLGIPNRVDPRAGKRFAKSTGKETLYQQYKHAQADKRVEGMIAARESKHIKDFDDASRAKIIKTYKFDPTKARTSSSL